jgi:Carboxypeptidase regulatory-like domain
MRLLSRLSWIASAAVLSSSQIVVPTDSAPQGPRTAIIAGHVLDATGAPVPDAIVRLPLPKYAATLPTTPRDRVMADRAGRFSFANLPAGDYFLQATSRSRCGSTP